MKALVLLLCAVMVSGWSAHAQELYRMPSGVRTGWISPENPTGGKGKAGAANKGAKGRAFVNIRAGETLELLSLKGPGIIKRIWMTINDRNTDMLRSLKIEMFWDDSRKPAVSAPLGDFFCFGMGKISVFENEFFASPEAKSLACTIPMPFKRSARISITNESDRDLKYIFYDINYLLTDTFEPGTMYFHCYWSRDTRTKMRRDFEVLPKISGRGRYLGANIGVRGDSVYENTWWGEGEVKIYLDGDGEYPSLTGTGAEDYIGTGWGQGVFIHRLSGCLVADPDSALTLVRLLEKSDATDLSDPGLPSGWVNFYRQDDVCAAAYFYLDAPSSTAPDLAPVRFRTHGTK